MKGSHVFKGTCWLFLKHFSLKPFISGFASYLCSQNSEKTFAQQQSQTQ